MNLCFFTGNMGDCGGTEKMTQLLSKTFVNNNNNVFVLTKSNKAIEPHFKLEKDVKYDILNNGKYIRFFTVIKDIFLLAKYIRKNKIDVLINVDVSLGLFSLPLKIFCPKLKQIFWEHFCVLYNINSKRTDKLRKLALKYGDAYVVLTSEDKQALKSRYKVNTNLVDIPNICETCLSSNAYNLESKIILSVGNLINVKGFDMAIDVADKVFEKHPDWCWHIYGDGDDREMLRKKIIDFSLEKNVKLMGRKEDLSSVYDNAALFVLTSRSEGFGLVLIEAQSHFLPTVAFSVPFGPQNIIENGVNGFLIESFNIDAMAQKICTLIEEKKLRDDFSKKSVVNINKYSSENILQEWNVLLKKIM